MHTYICTHTNVYILHTLRACVSRAEAHTPALQSLAQHSTMRSTAGIAHHSIAPLSILPREPFRWLGAVGMHHEAVGIALAFNPRWQQQCKRRYVCIELCRKPDCSASVGTWLFPQEAIVSHYYGREVLAFIQRLFLVT